MLQDFLIFLGVLLALLGLFQLGFMLKPRPFRAHPAPGQPGEPQPLDPHLPGPVRRYFIDAIGENPQAVRTAVVWGRGKACVRGVWLPFRYKAWIRPGAAFTRRVEMTWFLRPVLRGFETYQDGKGAQEAAGKTDRGPRIDHEEALAMWAASLWLPSFLASPSPARWEPVDEFTARLVFPVGAVDESMLFYFDPESGRMTHITGLRYSGDPGDREPWRIDLLEWKPCHGMLIPGYLSIAFGEPGSPCSYWSVDGTTYNVNVSDQLPEHAGNMV